MAVAEAAKPTRGEVNYRPVGNMRLGSYTKATVLPRWVVELSGRSADAMIRDGLIEETMDPVVQDFRAPETKEESLAPAIFEELDNLRSDNAKLRSENKGLAANNETLRASNASLKVSLAEQTETIAHWRSQAEGKRAEVVIAEKRIADLESELELERTTRPEVKPEPPAPKPVQMKAPK
jgi:predicted RNase H-like nuclease (RuvC/YqgF family)